MKILYIARGLNGSENGASQVMMRNRRVLKAIVGEDNVYEYYLPKASIKNVIGSFIRLGSYGVTRNEERKILDIASSYMPDFAFIESSSFGSLYKILSKQGIKTICFAHNLDTELCRQEISSRSPLISLPKYVSTRLNERRTVKYADYLICLNERDSRGFYESFGRKADLILPITFPLKALSDISSIQTLSKPYYLFVGSNFFPNIEGIAWFIKNVAPNVDADFHIVGSCCESETLQRLNCPNNVKYIGYAEDLDAEYRNSVGIIAPIFKGSGMKTKTIEALSYGKSIFGTDEAFAGIDCDFSMIGGRCNTQDSFIKALNSHKKLSFNKYSYEIFIRKYSDEYFIEDLKCFINRMFD